MPYSPSEFAARIKSKYPDYAGMDDDELVQKIVAKYPDYRNQISFAAPATTRGQAATVENPTPASLRSLAETERIQDSVKPSWWQNLLNERINFVGGMAENTMALPALAADAAGLASPQGFARAAQRVGTEGLAGAIPATTETARIFDEVIGTGQRAIGITPEMDADRQSAASRLLGGMVDVAPGIGLASDLARVTTKAAPTALNPAVAAILKRADEIEAVGDVVSAGRLRRAVAEFSEMAAAPDAPPGRILPGKNAHEETLVGMAADISKQPVTPPPDNVVPFQQPEAAAATGTDPLVAAEARRYLAQHPETPREARGQLFREGPPPEPPGGATPEEPPLPPPVKEGRFGGAWRRYIATNTAALKSTGPTGREVARKLYDVERDSVHMAAEPIHAIGIVKKLSKDDQDKLVSVLDGTLPRNQASPVVQRLADLHRAYLDRFGQMAEEAGLLLRTPKGELVPFKRRGNYFPHFSKGEPDMPVFAGPDELSPGQRLGSMENVRSGEGEFVRDPVAVLTSYYEDAARKLAEVKHFGADVTKAIRETKMKARMSQEPEDFIEQSMKQALGGGMRWGRFEKGLAADIMNAEVAAKLPLAVIGNITQPVNTLTAAGFKPAVKALVDIARSVRKPELIDVARRTGATLEGTIRALKVGDATSVPARIAQAVLRGSGFNAAEKFNRIHAAQTGINYAQDLARALVGDRPSWLHGGVDKIAEQLRKMDVDVDAVMANGGKLSEQDQLNAGFYMSHKTQFGNRPEDVPLEWSSSPQMRVWTQFKGFGVKQAKFLKDDVVKPALLEGNVLPLARFVVAGAGVGASSNAVRDLIAGRMEELQDKTLKQHFVDGLVVMAMSNLMASAYRSLTYGQEAALEFGAGPGASDIARQITTVFNTVRAVAKDEPEKVPGIIKRDIKKTLPATRNIFNRLEK